MQQGWPLGSLSRDWKLLLVVGRVTLLFPRLGSTVSTVATRIYGAQTRCRFTYMTLLHSPNSPLTSMLFLTHFTDEDPEVQRVAVFLSLLFLPSKSHGLVKDTRVLWLRGWAPWAWTLEAVIRHS